MEMSRLPRLFLSFVLSFPKKAMESKRTCAWMPANDRWDVHPTPKLGTSVSNDTCTPQRRAKGKERCTCVEQGTNTFKTPSHTSHRHLCGCEPSHASEAFTTCTCNAHVRAAFQAT